MKIRECIILTLLLLSSKAIAQVRIDLWPEGKMPNSKGITLQDSISNERIYQVGKPRIQAFFTSDQENKGAAVLIIPGGGYARLAYEVSGFQLAKWFNTMGMHAFVLDHRLPKSPDIITGHLAPLQDAQRALKVIRSNAATWGIDVNKIGVLGSSAGGHLAATLSNSFEDVSTIGDTLDSLVYLPDFQILISPVIDMGEYAHRGSKEQLLGSRPSQELIDRFSLQKQVTAKTPIAFIIHASNDNVVHAANSLLYMNSLLQKNVSSSLHIFPDGKHALALRNNPGSASTWIRLCEEWLIEKGIISRFK